MKSPVWHRYFKGVHHYWGFLLSRRGILHLHRYRRGRYAVTKLRGVIWHAGSIELLNFRARKHSSSTSRIHLSYYIRRPVFKFSMAVRLFWRYLWNDDIRMCVFCGERFATLHIPNPNFFIEKEKEPSLVKVCEPCSEWVKDSLFQIISGKRCNKDFWGAFKEAHEFNLGVLPHG